METISAFRCLIEPFQKASSFHSFNFWPCQALVCSVRDNPELKLARPSCILMFWAAGETQDHCSLPFGSILFDSDKGRVFHAGTKKNLFHQFKHFEGSGRMSVVHHLAAKKNVSQDNFQIMFSLYLKVRPLFSLLKSFCSSGP